MEMYREYLNKKRVEKNITIHEQTMQVDNNGSSIDPIEESKQEKPTLRTGDKYIIRKLVSMKIIPEQIQDFISMVINGRSSGGMVTNGVQMGYPSLAAGYNNQFNYVDNNYVDNNYVDNNYMQIPQQNTQMRSNSCYASNNQMNLGSNQNMGFVDDSQLIQSFAQFSLMNQNPNYCQNTTDAYQIPIQNSTNSNDISLENNFSNYGQHLSSVPAHMTSTKMNRSHSINNRESQGSGYMTENFLFDKIGEKTSKDDTTIKIYQNPITLEND
mmetsp:Transcript_881/g.762  ORF Transcript_881/g.762 Transcript_881/m.762 type:complete len:270 (+) Transcript_881:430-1239(+)|eukprot:CAMPEP_0205809592 /NCGR_PEP_ID=MMETSP0205-20121125/13853_1 /ASSEMBLY_ACC=CAM_ASM_000278 /TAXON_ID=36767 /ORGANISM="Euplotes focardii, Strain TN1" /LENGTH=269 /DNA_ID=CAMNT_0053087039 /DNA_START=347 /DNA_END=1156 /DNA_ORIENTATION=+